MIPGYAVRVCFALRTGAVWIAVGSTVLVTVYSPRSPTLAGACTPIPIAVLTAFMVMEGVK